MSNDASTSSFQLCRLPPPLPPPLPNGTFETNISAAALDIANEESFRHTSDIESLFGSDFEFHSIGAALGSTSTDINPFYPGQLQQQFLHLQQQQQIYLQKLRQPLPTHNQDTPNNSKKRFSSEDNALVATRDTKRASVHPFETANTQDNTAFPTQQRLVQCSDDDDELSSGDIADESCNRQQMTAQMPGAASTVAVTYESEEEWEDEYYDEPYDYEYETEVAQFSNTNATAHLLTGVTQQKGTQGSNDEEGFENAVKKETPNKHKKSAIKKSPKCSSSKANSKSRTKSTRKAPNARARDKDSRDSTTTSDTTLESRKRMAKKKCKIEQCVLVRIINCQLLNPF